jgi:hypothetical protein
LHSIGYVWGGAAASVAALLLTSCGTTGAPEPSAAEPSISVKAISRSDEVNLPLAHYTLAEADQDIYFKAVNIAQGRCAKAIGVVSTVPVTVQPTEGYLRSVRRYGVINESEVARRGYALPAPPEPEVAWNPSELEAEVMQGPDGCAAAGVRDVLRSEPDPMVNRLVDDHLRTSWGLTIADSRALAVAKAWSNCMSRNGYAFPHRWDAGNSVAGKPPDLKIAMAELDLDCAVETNYNGILYAIDSAYQERMIDENRKSLQQVLASELRVMKQARLLLRDLP